MSNQSVHMPTSALMDEPLKLIEENATLRKQVEELAGALENTLDELSHDTYITAVRALSSIRGEE